MTKRHALFIISMMSAIIVCIMVMSFAWFSASGTTHVGANGVQISAHDPSVLTIGAKIIQEAGSYRGETGVVYYRYVTDDNNDEYTYLYDDNGQKMQKTFPYYSYSNPFVSHHLMAISL